MKIKKAQRIIEIGKNIKTIKFLKVAQKFGGICKKEIKTTEFEKRLGKILKTEEINAKEVKFGKINKHVDTIK